MYLCTGALGFRVNCACSSIQLVMDQWIKQPSVQYLLVFAPLLCYIHRLQHLHLFSARSSRPCHKFGWRTCWSLSFFPCNTATTACADGISAVELSVMNAITEHPELHYIQQELIIFIYCVYRWSNLMPGLLDSVWVFDKSARAQGCCTLEVASA